VMLMALATATTASGFLSWINRGGIAVLITTAVMKHVPRRRH
jgi:hypothetical protein